MELKEEQYKKLKELCNMISSKNNTNEIRGWCQKNEHISKLLQEDKIVKKSNFEDEQTYLPIKPSPLHEAAFNGDSENTSLAIGEFL